MESVSLSSSLTLSRPPGDRPDADGDPSSQALHHGPHAPDSVGQKDHGRRASLPVRPSRQEGQVEGSDHGETHRKHARSRRRNRPRHRELPGTARDAFDQVKLTPFFLILLFQTMDLHASQIQGFFDIPVDK